MSDTLLRAIARDAGIQICAASTTELVERAHEIHNTTPLATAALGRTLTATAIMGSQLKVEDGSVTVICDDCDEVLSTETLPATGHSTVVKNAKDATCTEPGYTGDKVCTVCGETGETGETGEVIPAAGHSYKDGKCTVCGAADPNANSGGNTGNNGTDSPNTADGAAMGLWLSLMTVAALAGAVLVAGKTPDSPLSQRSS